MKIKKNKKYVRASMIIIKRRKIIKWIIKKVFNFVVLMENELKIEYEKLLDIKMIVIGLMNKV